MPITFDCPCGKTLRVPDEHAKKRAKCPACGAVLTVPEAPPPFEVMVVPPLPPEPGAPVEPVEEPEPVSLPPLPSRGYVAGFVDLDEDEDEDKTPYSLADGENDKRSSDMDSDGNARRKGGGLPNFNKGKKKFG